MRKLFKFLLITLIVLAAAFVCHTFWITPFCHYTYAAEMWIRGFDTSNIIPQGPLELGTISGIGSLAGGATYLWRKTSTKFNTFKKQTTTQINNMTGSYRELEGKTVDQEIKLEETKGVITELEDKTKNAEEAKQAAESKVSDLEKQVEHYRVQMENSNKVAAMAEVMAKNKEVVRKVIS